MQDVNNDNLDELLSEFSNFDPSLSKKLKQEHQEILDLSENEALEKFVQQKSQKLIFKLLEVTENLLEDAQSQGDADLISSVSRLSKTAIDSIEILNKQLMRNKDNLIRLQLQALKNADPSALLQQGSNENHKQGVLASREEIFKNLIKNAQLEQESNEAIDAESFDVD